jgi:hypothetical protein
MKALVLAVALVALSGCGEESSTTGLAGPLTYVRSGGFAGETQELKLQPDGSGTITSDLGGQESANRFTLTPAERERIAQLVGEADLATLQPRRAPPVDDGYTYELTYGGLTVRWEMDGTPERAGELVEVLGALAESHRP